MAHLAHEGFDPAFGARPLKRIIQREIGDPAAVLLLEGKVADGGTIHVDAVDGELTVSGVSSLRHRGAYRSRRDPLDRLDARGGGHGRHRPPADQPDDGAGVPRAGRDDRAPGRPTTTSGWSCSARPTRSGSSPTSTSPRSSTFPTDPAPMPDRAEHVPPHVRAAAADAQGDDRRDRGPRRRWRERAGAELRHALRRADGDLQPARGRPRHHPRRHRAPCACRA